MIVVACVTKQDVNMTKIFLSLSLSLSACVARLPFDAERWDDLVVSFLFDEMEGIEKTFFFDSSSSFSFFALVRSLLSIDLRERERRKKENI